MAAKKSVKPPVKKPAAKKTVKPPTKAVAKPTAKKPAVKAPAKKLAPPSKPARAPAAKSDYRKLRKYTVPKLLPFLDPAETPKIRARIKSTSRGPLTAVELVNYLKKIEGEMPDWAAKRLPPPDGKPRRRGRPPKAESEKNKKASLLKPKTGSAPVKSAKAALAAVKAKLSPPKPPQPKKLVPPKPPVSLNGAARKPLLRLTPPKPATA